MPARMMVLRILVGAVTLSIALSPVVGRATTYSIEVTDPAALAEFADNVFFGRVVDQIGSEGQPYPRVGGSFPMTQFSVSVVAEIKGRITESVIVNQHGGVDEHTGELLLFEDDPLLEPGTDYLFVTKCNPDKGWHMIVAPGYANIHIDDAMERSMVEMRFERATGLESVPVSTGAGAATVTGDMAAACASNVPPPTDSVED